jgi:hypothetical protein
MSHVLLRRTATPDVGSVPSAVDCTHRSPTRVLVTEQEVVFSTAAATSVPAMTRHHRLATTLTAAISRIHIALPEPRPHYPRRELNYFEATRMSREMDHL